MITKNISSGTSFEESEINDCWNNVGVLGKGDRTCNELQSVIHCRNCAKFISAARKVLDKNVSKEYKNDVFLQTYSEIDRERKHQTIVTFRICDQWFGLPPKCFHEVIKWKGIHSIPHNRSEKINGLVAIRGELQLCVSLEHILGVSRGGASVENIKDGIYKRMVVLSGTSEKYVFPVSEIHDIYHYAMSELCEPPATASIEAKKVVSGVLYRNKTYVSCLDFKILNDLIGNIFE